MERKGKSNRKGQSYERREIKLKSNLKKDIERNIDTESKGLKTRYKDNLDREKARTNVAF